MAQSPLSAPSPTGLLELEDIQGILLDPYDSLPAACYLLLQITDAAAARRWLQGLPLTSSMGHRTAPAAPALNAAFTWPGLKALRERDDPLLFPAREFREGMVTSHRSRVLGDLELSAPESWRWRGDEASASSDVVHLALLAYAADGEALETLVNGTLSVAGAEGVRLIERIDAVELLGSKEHFGFRDGIGQPLVEGDSEGKAGDQVIAAGEFILGYRNGFGA